MPRQKKRGATGASDATEALNLVPIMNLVVCLIPMVLFGASFVKLGAINVTGQPFGDAQTEATVEEEPLALTVAIGGAGFHISSRREGIAEDIPKQGDDQHFTALYNRLVAIKASFPNETSVRVTADAHIPFREIVRVMDTVRVRLQADRYDSLVAFREAAPRIDDNRAALLWPDVMLAVAMGRE